MSTDSSLAAVTDPDRHSRENFWGGDADDDGDQGGHVEVDGTDPAEYIAYNHLRALVKPICERHLDEEPNNGGRLAEQCAWLFDNECIDGRGDQLHRKNKAVELTAPEFHLPKQIERNGRYIEYRQHRHRRRYNPETGYINWGETTTTGLPEVDHDVFEQALHNYLAERVGNHDITWAKVEEYLEMAERYWSNQQLNSHQSLAKTIEFIRGEEPDNRDS